jgi:hypothetical protein
MEITLRALLLPAVVLVACACGGSSKPAASGACGPCAASAGAPSLPPHRSAKLEALAARRVELARKRLAQLRESFAHGSTTLDELFAASRDVAFAARDSGLSGAPLRDVLKDYRDAVTALKELTKERLAKGAVDAEAMTRVEALEAEAEFWLADASEGLP